MAISTEDTFRDWLVEVLQSIAVTGFEFSNELGNVKDYLLEFADKEGQAKYLSAYIDGRNTVRAWAVDVLGNDDWFAAGGITNREYRITFQGYYAKGVEGEGYKLLVKHSRKLREALRDLGPTLGGYVTYVTATGRPDIRVVGLKDNDIGEILVGTTVYVAQRTNADF